jgi:hypothetical protein
VVVVLGGSDSLAGEEDAVFLAGFGAQVFVLFGYAHRALRWILAALSERINAELVFLDGSRPVVELGLLRAGCFGRVDLGDALGRADA